MKHDPLVSGPFGKLPVLQWGDRLLSDTAPIYAFVQARLQPSSDAGTIIYMNFSIWTCSLPLPNVYYATHSGVLASVANRRPQLKSHPLSIHEIQNMKMNYFVFGTNDMQKSMSFYDAFFEGSGVSKVHSEGRMSLWANDEFMFGIAEPFDGGSATNGNGTMLGLNLGSAEQVTRLYNNALELGGVSEGEPCVRSGRYSAYVRDLDKNKICLFE